MSKIGKNPIAIPEGVIVTIDKGVIVAKGPLGELKQEFPNFVVVTSDNKEVTVKIKDVEGVNRSKRNFWGLYRTLILNIVEGVKNGFKKELEIQGVGYRVGMKGADIELNVGFSHPVIYKVPEGVKVTVNKDDIIIEGIDKQKVGQVAAEIRSIKKPDAYKGKGLRYKGEEVHLKAGKKAVGE